MSGAVNVFGYFAHFINKCALMPAHGNCCLGTGVETCSGEFSGCILATGEADRHLWREGRQAAAGPNLGHLGACKDLWGLPFWEKESWEELDGKEPGALTLQLEDVEWLGARSLA